MRTERVFTNYVCNHACTFCSFRKPSDDPAEIAHATIAARIADAAQRGAQEVVLTGGEPTMRRDLAALVRFAKARGVPTIVLETNASLLDEARARALRDAGVDVVCAHVPAIGPSLAAITRDADAPLALERGLRAILRADLALDVSIPLVRSNLGDASSLVPALVRIVGDAARIRSVILRVPHESPDPTELLSYEAAVPGLLAVSDAARTAGIDAKLAPDSGPPPCVFPRARRPAHLYSLSGSAPFSPHHTYIDACDSCRVRPHCPGFRRAHVDRFGVPSVVPVDDERTRRRLTLITTVDEQIGRELVTRGGRPSSGGGYLEDTIRVNFHCNQACDFCFVSTHLPLPEEDLVRRAILSAVEGGRAVVLSGGEPTLNPRLPEYVRLAARSKHPVELQTNATRLDNMALATELRDAGLHTAFVSLHGAHAETGDRVTRAPGTFEKTLRGVDNLHALGIELRLNFVICKTNVAELPDMIELVAKRWPRAGVTISFVARSTDVVPKDHDFLPRYTEVRPFIARAMQIAADCNVPVTGFESMCGIPLCLAPWPLDRLKLLPELEEEDARGEFLKPEPCGTCSLSSRCWGIRRSYVEVHGYDELRPISGPLE